MMRKKLRHFSVLTTITDRSVFTDKFLLKFQFIILYPLVILLFPFQLRTPDKNVPLT